MAFVLKLDNYQGPFDVLLSLLNAKQLDITDFSLSKITDDYLAYISKLELELEEVNWFLFVATKLTYHKSLAVLTIQQQNEEDDTDLAETLRRYARIKVLANILAIRKTMPQYSRDYNMPRPIKLCSKKKLCSIFVSVIKSSASQHTKHTIQDKSAHHEHTKQQFQKHISKLRKFNSSEILSNSKTRTEAAIYLLTILGMLRDGKIRVQQDQFIMTTAP